MRKDKLWSSAKRSILGPLLFLLYINDLLRTINNSPIPILLADDTSFLVADPNVNDSRSKLSYVFNIISKWFMVNSLSLNLNKTYYMQCKGTVNL
jgi:hypothetical protein